MMTLSKPLSAGQAKKYYDAEYTSARESYYSEDDTIKGEWFGKLAKEWELQGPVETEAFNRLIDGQHPRTGAQLVRHVSVKEFKNRYGENVKNSEHRAGYDATFSAPKSVSLAALVGGDERIREAHRKAVKTALTELENYVQARMGGKTPALTTTNLAAALFEHDAARPDKENGYAAPQLHTHSVIFNLTQLPSGQIKPIQPVELYRSQKYATAIYRAVLGEELQKLGYEIEVDPRTGAPEIKGFCHEYLVASSPRRKQIEIEAGEIKSRYAQQGIEVKQGAGLNQAAAKLDRRSKRYDRAEMRARHQELDMKFDREAATTVASAYERGPMALGEEEIKRRAQAAVTFARQNAGAREAVVDKRQVMVDALRRNLGFTTHEAVVNELNDRIESGEFIQIQRFDKFEELTTSQMLALERSNIHQMLAGRDTQKPMMERKEASEVIKQIFGRDGKRSSYDQYKAVGTILVSRDKVTGLVGLAGSGKTTALAILREAAEREGFVVQGLAPTGSAADNLAESGIKTTTLQGYLRQPQFRPDEVSANRRLFVLDEASLSDTKNLYLFLEKAGPQSRILLVGDPVQHQAVEAGAPFEQLIKAGIRTASLDKILRQRTDLKKPVELLSRKEVLAAVAVLESQGRITEIKDDLDRLNAIASDYIKNPKGTLIISPANSERVAINSLIHHQFQEQGVVSRSDHEMTILVNRQDMTGPERTFALAYSPGEDIIRYNTNSKVYGVKPGNYGRVLANNHEENTITVRLESGRELTYNPARLSGVSVYREAQREFAAGDRIQFRAPYTQARVKNSELGTIEEIADSKMRIRLDKKREVTVDLEQFRHLDHGYAVTSHSSQGQTVNRVIVNAETTETDLLLNQRMAYVALSRARFEARIYTDSVKELGPAFNRQKNKEIALDAVQDTETQQHSALAGSPIPEGKIASERTAYSNQSRVKPFAAQMREMNDRLVLGQHLSASLEDKYAEQKLEGVLNTREVRRYPVMDVTTRVRREMSIRDVERRAMVVAKRIASEQQLSPDGDSSRSYHWTELSDIEYASQIEIHKMTIAEITQAHGAEVQKLTSVLQSARTASVRTSLRAEQVTDSYESTSRDAPPPIISHEKLDELQFAAIRNRDVNGFEQLEQIRRDLPHELGGPDRDRFSFARLRGEMVLADSNVAVAGKRVCDFEKTRHFAKFEIEGEQWSLVRVDRQQRLLEREIEFHRGAVSAYRKRLYGAINNPFKLLGISEYRDSALLAKESMANAQEGIRNLQPFREEVFRLINEHRSELKQDLSDERSLAHSLNHAFEHETEARSSRDEDLPRPEFNKTELRRLEDNAITLRDPEMLREAHAAMELHNGTTREGTLKLLSRTAGRAEAVEVSLREITQRIESFVEDRAYLPVLFEGPDGQDRTMSLHDLLPRTITEKVFTFLSPKDRLEIKSVNESLDQIHNDLLSQRDSLEQFSSIARQITGGLERQLPALDYEMPNLAQHTTHPQFTVEEMARLENFAVQQTDPLIREQFENLTLKAMLTNHTSEAMTQSLEQSQFSFSSDGPLEGITGQIPQSNSGASDRRQVKAAEKPAEELLKDGTVIESEMISESWAVLL